MKRKLLASRYTETALSFLRLIAMVAFGALGVYSLLGSFSLFGLKQKTAIIFIVLVFLCYVSKYALDAWRKKTNFLIDNFEDTAKYSHKKGKFGEFDEDGDLNIGLMLKRGSEDADHDLKELIGLEHVKEEVRKMESVFNFEAQQKKNSNHFKWIDGKTDKLEVDEVNDIEELLEDDDLFDN